MCTLSSMFKWLAKLFMKKQDLDMETNTAIMTTPETQETSIAVPQKRKHKLEIQVYEADYDGIDPSIPNAQPKWKPVRSDPVLDGGRPTIIEVADKRELAEMQRQFAMCDQRIKIIREIDPFDDEPPKPPKAQIPQNNQAIPVGPADSISQQAPQQAQAAVPQLPAPQPAAVKPKPKIVTIGDIEVKYDGDKVYQKQWVKLSSTEAANFRVVNDTSNKIVPLAGKHIECRRWVVVEETHDDTAADIMSIIGE